MSDRDLDARVAAEVMGDDIGYADAHIWERDEEGEIRIRLLDDERARRYGNVITCTRCGATPSAESGTDRQSDIAGALESGDAKTRCYLAPRPYSSNAGHDYTVLEYVRDNWPIKRVWAFVQVLGRFANERAVCPLVNYVPLFYQPGDYSRAALDALDKTAGQKP